MKIKFDSGDNLPSNKTIEIPIMTIVVRTVFFLIIVLSFNQMSVTGVMIYL